MQRATSLRATYLILAGIWLLLLVVAQHTRPLLPLDETRYASVAWEMWLRGDFLVPFKNGEAYSHKPPLLFWLIHAGWWAFGVNEWWPRTVAPLFALGSLFLVVHLGGTLWPERAEPARLAPLLLMGIIFWVYFNTATMFDMLVVFFTLSALSALLLVHRTSHRSGWLGFGAALGLGILAKGPVILLYTLPLALLAPLWVQDRRPRRWLGWYLGLALAVAVAAAIALAWALPAAAAGGTDYANAILWGQTAGRVAQSFAHQRPFWWYFVTLPLLLFPLSLWLGFWRALGGARHRLADPGVRFCLLWFSITVVALSFISSKQPHYLLPALPPLTLLATLELGPQTARPGRFVAAASSLIGLGAVIAVAPLVARWAELPAGVWWLSRVPGWSGWLLVVCGLFLAAWRRTWPPAEKALVMALSVTVMTIAAHYSLLRTAAPAYDLSRAARFMHDLQDRGISLTHFGKYHAQFHFLGRLEQPLKVIDDRRVRVEAWLAEHPRSAAIHYTKPWTPSLEGDYAFAQPYRGGAMLVSLGVEIPR